MKSVQGESPPHHNNSLLNSSGFTLVELMVVVVIIAILVAVATPVYEGKPMPLKKPAKKYKYHPQCRTDT